MFAKAEYEDQLEFAKLMKSFGTNTITAIVKGECREVDIEMYIVNLEQFLNELNEDAIYH